jgi:hypothetical protein
MFLGKKLAKVYKMKYNSLLGDYFIHCLAFCKIINKKTLENCRVAKSIYFNIVELKFFEVLKSSTHVCIKGQEAGDNKNKAGNNFLTDFNKQPKSPSMFWKYKKKYNRF